MAVQEHRRGESPASGFVRLPGRARFTLLLTAALVFATLVQVANLAVMPALFGFAMIALAVFLRESAMPDVDEAPSYGRSAMAAIAERAVEAIVSSLPDPTIALTSDSLVVAFNASVQQIT